MATLEQLSTALVKADAAGNTADAKVFADAIRQMQAAPAAPELPQAMQPSVAQVAPSDIPGARKDLTTGQRVYQVARPFVAPLLEAGGAISGGLLGTPMGPAGIVGGAGLGYGIAKEGLQAADVAMGVAQPRQGAAQVTEPLRNVVEGATFEAGGRAVGQALGYLGGKIMDLKNIPKNKAAEIARNALGPDLPEVLNALKAAQGTNVSPAQATANINSPTWQALLDRVSQRDPRFIAALKESQGEVSLNALARLAGGATAAETRGTTEAAKNALNTVQGPTREASLSRANLGKAVADYEAQAGKLSAEAAAQVQEVRRLIDLGDHAAAAARLETIKAGYPASSRLAPAKSQAGFSDAWAATHTYPGKLAQMSDDWASKAANASLDLGQGAQFAQGAANALRSVGIKPLESSALVRNITAVTQNPEFAGNDVMKASVTNLARDIAEWTGTGGVIDARALDAIRKNSVNAAVRDLLKGQDPSVQREAAASVMTKLKPLIVDAIEGAGGTGYRQYLADYTKGMQQIAEKKLTGEARRLWTSGPEGKDAFVKLVQNESPDVVEKFLGKGNYNIATELSDNTMSILREQAQKRITDIKTIEQAHGKEGVPGGQDALKRLLLENLSLWRVPTYLTAVASTTNKALSILENKIGKRAMTSLAEASKTPEAAVNLLETLPADEKVRILKLLSNPTEWSKGGKAAATGTTTMGVNSLAPDRYNTNALTNQPVRIIETQAQ